MSPGIGSTPVGILLVEDAGLGLPGGASESSVRISLAGGGVDGCRGTGGSEGAAFKPAGVGAFDVTPASDFATGIAFGSALDSALDSACSRAKTSAGGALALFEVYAGRDITGGTPESVRGVVGAPMTDAAAEVD